MLPTYHLLGEPETAIDNTEMFRSSTQGRKLLVESFDSRKSNMSHEKKKTGWLGCIGDETHSVNG